jgi:AAHS family 4-hydroxybenzoate transporter-like MFS transporter
LIAAVASHPDRHRVIIAMCALVAMIDGFDTQSIALVAPAIVAAWRVAAPSFGLVFGAGLFGSFIGAVTFGIAADRFGRKPILVIAVFAFGLITLMTPFTRTIEQLVIIRFLTGLGLGGVLPGIISITSEYSPSESRATSVALMFCGFPLGAVIGGVVAAGLISKFGWASLFYVGAAIPLLLLPLIWAIVPESARFLMSRQRGADAGAAAVAAVSQVNRAPLIRLFTHGRALGTMLLSSALWCSLLLTYFLVNWLPILASQAGLGIKTAVLGVAALNFGAIGGCLVIGRLADRYSPAVPVGIGYAIGAGAIALMGAAGPSKAFLLLACLAAGFFSIGAQMCTVALCATFYDTSLRATGVGWSMGVGRTGAICGPVVGGILIARGVTTPTLFIIAGIVSLGASAAILIMGRYVLPVMGLNEFPTRG